MMGEEPLEVPAASSQQSSSTNVIHTPPPIHHHHHHYPTSSSRSQQTAAAQLLDQQQHQHSDSPPVWIDNNAQQSERALSREKLVNAYGSSSSNHQQQQQTAQVCSGNNNNSNNKLNTTPRRTRHRVDAGEPRGCFNSSNALPNLNHHHAWGHGIQHQQQQQRTNHNLHRHVYPHFLPVVHPQFHPQQQQQRSRTSPPSDGYYFQPMKMLSEFISSASAVAAAQAAHVNSSSAAAAAGLSPSRSISNNSAADNQLLLREMLCKSANMSNVNNNNHEEYENNSGSASELHHHHHQHKSLKSSKLDGMIGMMMDKLSSSSPTPPPPEVTQQQQQHQRENNNLNSSSEAASEERERNESADAAADEMMMEENNSTASNNNNSAADLLNNNNPSGTTGNSGVGGGALGQVRNKRKKYQPQRSDLVECSEVGNGGIEDLEELEDDDEELLKEESEEQHENNNRRITRSQQRRIRNTADPEEDEEASDFTDAMKPTRVKRKVSAEECFSDMDEEDAMLLRPIASGSRSSAATTNPDDAESMIQEYENEEEEQEAMINDDLQHDQDRENEIGSRRTLPVVRNLMRIQHREQQQQQQQLREREASSNVKEAPLTRQLLTSERPTSTPPTNTLVEKSSILRSATQQTPRSPPTSDLPNGLTNNPANSFLQQWKENLKTTLMSHINELVDAQFSLLLGGGMLPPGGGLVLPPHLQQRMLTHEHERRSLRESNNSRSLQEPKVEQKRTPPPPPPSSQNPQVQTPQNARPQSRDVQHQQQKPLIHLNGGSVLNTEKMAHIGSPPMSDVKKLPVGRASNNERSSEYPGIPPRFPFMQNNERSMIPGGIQQNGKPHFSSALVGLSNHHLQQQAVAAAVAANAVAAAAGIENMFDNDGALSLVVGNRGGGSGNGGPGVHDIVHGNVTPRKKRHKVTDTRLTPRAVSRLLGQVDTTPASSTSPLYDHHAPSSSSPQASPHHHSNNPIEPRSILQNGTPPPRENTRGERTTPQASSQQQNDPPRSIFNPFHPPGAAPGSTPFFHPAALAAAAAAGHPLHPSQLARLDSPPMGNSLLHPALQNPSEYVERLREMSMEREHHQERNTRVGSDNVVVRDRGEHHHHHASLREYPSVRGLRDRGTGGGSIMLSNDVLDLIGRAGSAGGSDSGGESGSAFELGGAGGMYCKYSHTTSTLTPMHLRKAKLMFFWTRYPSSAVIKMYFPDIKFNKNNTAQLVKWFSNFREFYYIQMEKYARQALSEGVKQAEDLVVTTDSELYRVLNLHYNRNNHIEVPSNFRYVVEQTLREFFKSVQAGKDSEQSWKKAIYKIIARLDDPVPEYFKSPNFLEQLE